MTIIRYISMNKAVEMTGWSRSYLKKLDKNNPHAKIITKSPSGGPAFDTKAYNKLMSNQQQSHTSTSSSPAPLS